MTKKASAKKTDFIRMIQRFVAIESVGPSAVRNQGQGVLRAIQTHLGKLDLRSTPKDSTCFKKWLDTETDQLLNAMKDKVDGRPWGTARKATNLFLRACIYNHYLRKEYELGSMEKWLEIPLDGVVAKALKRKAGRGKLPPWPGLKHLRPEASEKFQVYAQELAKSLGLPARVFVDNFLWLANR